MAVPRWVAASFTTAEGVEGIAAARVASLAADQAVE
jgi:hypothetical protein